MPEITTHDIIKLFEEAATTDKRLPRAIKKQKTTAWMDHTQEKMYKHSYHAANFKVIPSSRDITRWSIASEILRSVVEDIEIKKLIWVRANKFPWTVIGRRFGYSRRKAKRIFEEEIIYIRLWLQLYEKNKKVNDMIDKIVLKKR
tara:strand:- start:265 stop:699 length:435 start_codon:yes stop_codon:yes gene_type:complete